jgi:hypothetical protein
VLPRYPGTRVLLAHRGDQSDDPIDIGAVCESGHGPDSQPGDFWLTLPTEVPSDKRQSIADDATPQEPTGKVTNDLIDADGNRVIEVGTLTIRIGKDNLQSAGTRPKAANDPVSIEHDSGTKITIDQNGNVSIEAKGDLSLKAGGKLNLEAKSDCNVKADSVKVSVNNTMDVT